MPREQKVTDPGYEQLLLHATVEQLVRHDLALQKNVDAGRHLVVPSPFNRDYDDAREPKDQAVAVTFDGSVQGLYSTLAVRLGQSGLFSTGRAEMWRNAAAFTAKAGGKCGLFLHECAEGQGRLILLFPDDHSNTETRFHFEESVLTHARRRVLDGTVELVRFFVCPDCGDPVPDSFMAAFKCAGAALDCAQALQGNTGHPQVRIRAGIHIGPMRVEQGDVFGGTGKFAVRTGCPLEWVGLEGVPSGA